jgi:hypothetical protein
VTVAWPGESGAARAGEGDEAKAGEGERDQRSVRARRPSREERRLVLLRAPTPISTSFYRFPDDGRVCTHAEAVNRLRVDASWRVQPECTDREAKNSHDARDFARDFFTSSYQSTTMSTTSSAISPCCFRLPTRQMGGSPIALSISPGNSPVQLKSVELARMAPIYYRNTTFSIQQAQTNIRNTNLEHKIHSPSSYDNRSSSRS